MLCIHGLPARSGAFGKGRRGAARPQFRVRAAEPRSRAGPPDSSPIASNLESLTAGVSERCADSRMFRFAPTAVSASSNQSYPAASSGYRRHDRGTA